MSQSKNIAILGSTGSIGRSALEVVRNVPGLNVVAISGFRNLELLFQQAAEFAPEFVVCADEEAHAKADLPDSVQAEILVGSEALNKIACLPEVDIVLASIVGIAGLPSTWSAVQAGKTVALANKETLVVAGHLISQLSRESSSKILPVDSEHSAVFQALQAGSPNEVKKIVLTASGGPFRQASLAEMQNVTVEQALAHPTWDMGQKVSIDSATMMNKGLELIEAKWLFDVGYEKLGVVIHPQSIVHSLVEFVDGSTLAQLSPPDMMLPIQYAFTYPERVGGPSPCLDFGQSMRLDFDPPDLQRFPALELGLEVVKTGGSSGVVLNAANEAAVEAFLNREIAFTDIALACRKILNQHNFEPHPSLDQLLELDQWARQEMSKWMLA